MIELPGWNDLISVNGFCYSSSIGESPKLNIPLKTSTAPTKGIAPATFARNSAATYIDDDGLLQTAGIGVIRFQNGRYLCEPAATNLFLQSGTPATKTITVVSGTIYTVQCYGSGSITLSGAGSGTVVEGTPITFTASSTSLTCTVSGSLNRAQVETGTQASSYIPTTTTSMTRAADSLHYAVGDVITQGQGSLYCEFLAGNMSGTLRWVLTMSDGTASNRLSIYINTLNILYGVGISGGVSNVELIGVVIPSTISKCVLTYKENNVKLYLNGTLVATDSVCSIPISYTTLSVGINYNGTYCITGEIGNIKYFKEVLTEAEAIKLTTV